MHLNDLINAILQVFVLTLIPLIVFLIKYRTFKGFFEYIGLKRSSRQANLLALLIILLVGVPILALAYFNKEFRDIISGDTTMIGKFKTMGFSMSSLALLIIDAGIKTSLSEEIFFRGFVAKRLIAITSFQAGNILQAVIFGAVHALIFSFLTNNLIILFIMFFFPTIGAYFKGYLNEKLANGSIVPGWIAHGLGNILAYSGGYFLF